MVASPARLGAVSYNTESAFGENTNTYGTRLQVVSAVDVSGLTQDKQNIGITQQRPHEGVQDVRLTYGGSFTIELLLTGHGGTAASSLTATDLSTLLRYAIGNVRSADVGAVITTGTSATQFTATGITMTDGTLCRVGIIGDGRGGGQFAAVSGESTDVITLLTALGATPTPTTDTAYGALIVYPSETPGTFETVQSLRFQLQTANQQYRCHGCYPTAISFSGLNVGEIPKVTITYGVAWWESTSQTFPNTTATAAKAGAVIAAGSLFINAVGTSTRATYPVRDFSVTINYEHVPLTGPEGVDAFQGITGCVRTRCQATLTTTFDAESAGTHVWEDLYTTAEGSLTNRHILWTGSAVDGRAVGMYFPNCKIVSPRPTQVNVNDLNRVTVNWEALTGATTTSDLTLSNFRIGLG